MDVKYPGLFKDRIYPIQKINDRLFWYKKFVSRLDFKDFKDPVCKQDIRKPH